jgi:hypothetical protein
MLTHKEIRAISVRAKWMHASRSTLAHKALKAYAKALRYHTLETHGTHTISRPRAYKSKGATHGRH